MDSWEKWQNHVLLEQRRMNFLLEGLDKKVNSIHDDFLILKVKVSVYSSLFGALSAVAVSLIIKYV